MRLRMSRMVRSLGSSFSEWPLSIKACRTSAADRFVYRRGDFSSGSAYVWGSTIVRMSAASCGSFSSLRSRPRATKFSRQRIPRRASCSPFRTVSRPHPKRRSAWRALPSQSSVATSAMNNRRWYPVSRLAPEQIKASKHSVDASMIVPLPGVQTAKDQVIASHHIAGRGSSTPGRSRRSDRLMEQMDGYPVLNEEDYSNREYEATLENISDAAWRVKHEYTLPEGWESDVYSWLSDNRQSAVENRDDQGGYPEEDDLQAAFDA